MSLDFSQQYDAPIVTTSLTPQDEGEISLRPKLLADYTGQEKAKGNLSVYIEAARRRNEPLDHVLLYGPPGLGKTTLAGVIANEMGAGIRVTSGPAIEKAGRSGRPADEPRPGRHPVHRRDPPPQPCGGGDPVSGHGGLCHRHHRRQGPLGQLHPAGSAAASRSSARRRAPGSSPRPLRDRFGVQLRLELYTTEELQRIVMRSAGPARHRDRPRRRAGDRLALARHAAYRQPAARAGCATSRRCCHDGVITTRGGRPCARQARGRQARA